MGPQFVKTHQKYQSTTENVITTIKNIVSSVMDETMNSDANEMKSSTSTIDNESEINTDKLLNDYEIGTEQLKKLSETFSTSFEKVTSTVSSMEQHEEHDDYNYIIFIVLGIVLGLLIIAGAILAVIYNHYKKTGFHEIPGANKANCDVEPQSMVQIEQQIQQACSEDALLDKK